MYSPDQGSLAYMRPCPTPPIVPGTGWANGRIAYPSKNTGLGGIFNTKGKQYTVGPWKKKLKRK